MPSPGVRAAPGFPATLSKSEAQRRESQAVSVSQKSREERGRWSEGRREAGWLRQGAADWPTGLRICAEAGWGWGVAGLLWPRGRPDPAKGGRGQLLDRGDSAPSQLLAPREAIDTKSEACVQFSQIYPVVCVPSSFFIGESGIPLEDLAGSVSADELVTRIHKVRQMHSLKAETLVANGSQLESSVSTPFEPNNTSEKSQSRIVELCEAPPTSDTKSDSATGGESSRHATPSQETSGCSNQRPAEDLTVRVERLTKKT
ncbi:hypothetical protein MC885_015525 [Smutsia gigantea]|nr:hypothetical protein MC885_015525 [Smutsia gigantea]